MNFKDFGGFTLVIWFLTTPEAHMIPRAQDAPGRGGLRPYGGVPACADRSEAGGSVGCHSGDVQVAWVVDQPVAGAKTAIQVGASVRSIRSLYNRFALEPPGGQK